MNKNAIKIMLKVFALIGAAAVGLLGVWLLRGGSLGVMSLGSGCSFGGLLCAGLIVAAAAFLMSEPEPAV